MEIYVEYALLENFFFDGVLLYLSLKAARLSIKYRRLVVSAAIGAVFAVVFPLLRLPLTLAYALKYAVGVLLCFIAFPNAKSKNERGRYALSVVFFFVFSFFFGGALLGFLQEFFQGKVPSTLVVIGFTLLTGVSVFLIGKLYKRKQLYRYIYDCRLFFGQNSVFISGFLDSGNRVQKNGLPVCFVSPDILYDLRGEENWKDGGQVCDEITIQTLGGEKTTPIFKGELELFDEKKRRKKKVYFAATTNMLSREYKMILSPLVLEDGADEE